MRFSVKKCFQVLSVGLILYLLVLTAWFFSIKYSGGELLGSHEVPPMRGNFTILKNYLSAHLSPDRKSLRVWPSRDHFDDDRIIQQDFFVPREYRNQLEKGEKVPPKVFFVATPFDDYEVKAGPSMFSRCPVNACTVTYDRNRLQDADLVAFHERVALPAEYPRKPSQVWVLQVSESPFSTPSYAKFNRLFNWTSSYRRDSTMVAPYGAFVRYEDRVVGREQGRNYAEGKRKKVVWFVSNCNSANGRLRYARELSRHIQVDIYGNCGTLRCPRDAHRQCLRMAGRDYKFYLAFENCNCRDYVTEKLFVNALQNNLLPIVMGAHPDDYKRLAPHHSYIHVDDFDSPKSLAAYLNLLDRNDTLYNGYFRWIGTGFYLGDAGGFGLQFTFWCHACALLHDTEVQPFWYEDLDGWWRADGTCAGTEGWRKREGTSMVAIESESRAARL